MTVGYNYLWLLSRSDVSSNTLLLRVSADLTANVSGVAGTRNGGRKTEGVQFRADTDRDQAEVVHLLSMIMGF